MHRVDDFNTFDMLNINEVEKEIFKIITSIIKYRYNKNMLLLQYKYIYSTRKPN